MAKLPNLQALSMLLLLLGVAGSVAEAAQSGLITAGNIDDNLNFDHFLSWKDRMIRETCGIQGGQKPAQCILPNPDVSDRIQVEVYGGEESSSTVDGAPFFSNAIVEVFQNPSGEFAESIFAVLPSGTHGKVSLFPGLDGLKNFQYSSWEVRARAPDGSCPENCSEPVTMQWDEAPQEPVRFTIPAQPSLPTQLDVAFVIDTTGSMCDELDFVQAELKDLLAGSLVDQTQPIDVRVATIAYRDVGDEYLVKTTPFGSVDIATQAVQQETCGGGGDFPEAMDHALAQAANELEWREGNVARVLFLIADAPPHDEDFQRTLDAVRSLRTQGVRAYGLAASGAAQKAEYMLRLMALVTGARHMWLTDDSGIGDGHSEPSVVCYRVTRLDQLLTRVLRAELTGTRIEADPSEIIREVGQQKDGICLVAPDLIQPDAGLLAEVADIAVGMEGVATDGMGMLKTTSSADTSSRNSAGFLGWMFLPVVLSSLVGLSW